MGSDNRTGADNQQERLDAYLAGFVDGEGSFHVAVQRNPSTKLQWQLVPEFHVSQNVERREALDALQERLGCGRIIENHRGTRDRSLVFVVRKRDDLLRRVLPFFETQPLLSSKQEDFLAFASIVKAMERGEHLTRSGFVGLVRIALSMNGGGRYRRVTTAETVKRILRDHTPDAVTYHGEEMVRPAWRHAEPGRNDPAPSRKSCSEVTEVSVPIRCSRRKSEEGCP
jgi:hypothetical protein